MHTQVSKGQSLLPVDEQHPKPRGAAQALGQAPGLLQRSCPCWPTLAGPARPRDLPCEKQAHQVGSGWGGHFTSSSSESESEEGQFLGHSERGLGVLTTQRGPGMTQSDPAAWRPTLTTPARQGGGPAPGPLADGRPALCPA